MMAIGFPPNPTDGEVFIANTGSIVQGPVLIWRAAKGAWTKNAGTALPGNKLVNPAMQIDQLGTGAFTHLGYALDQWRLDFVGNAPNLAASRSSIGGTGSPAGALYNLGVDANHGV